MYLQGRITQRAKNNTNQVCSPIRLTGPCLRFLKNIFLILYCGTWEVVVHLGMQDEYLDIEQSRDSSKLLSAQKALRSTPFKRLMSNVHFKRLSY